MPTKPPYFTKNGVEIFAEDLVLAAIRFDEVCRDCGAHGNTKGRPALTSSIVGRWLAGETFESIARTLPIGGAAVMRRIWKNSRRAERAAGVRKQYLTN
jgi:hypothetical protein